jgi:hypothetical protein
MKQILKHSSIILILVGILFFLSSILIEKNLKFISPLGKPKPNILIKSIDTMKYSRDFAREKLNDKSFGVLIDSQVKNIALTGANYVAIDTPYDKEFIPFLKRWVSAARENNLKVWFRGNLSGWEQWFNYPTIDRSTHTRMISEFIRQNPDLFESGDIFTPCSECENGGPGDPRNTGDVRGFRNFLIAEYKAGKQAFKEINKNINVGYFSMNYDVAKLIMNPATTSALGGVVVIDHYVASPTELATDAKSLSQSSNGKIIFGETGAPIPDINGQMTDGEQADWIDQAMNGIFNSLEVVGVNYWVNTGGSTQIWNEIGTPKKAVQIITKYYISS